jgi:hypothetical protein
MNALVIGGIVFGCVFGGAMLGMSLRSVLPKQHLSDESKDAIKVSTAMVATLAALVVGLLTASAKSSFDGKETEMTQMVANIIVLDRTLAEYGPEAAEIRTQLRQVFATRLEAIWPDERTEKVDPDAIGRGLGFETIQRRLLDLAPQTDAQRWLKSTALQITSQMAQTRWLVFQQIGSSIQWPFLAILVFWLSLIFASFGLFAPRNGSVIAALFACALSVSCALYLIIQMDQPYTGLIKISSAPARAALTQLGRD